MLVDRGDSDAEQVRQRLLGELNRFVADKHIHFHRAIRSGVEKKLTGGIHSLASVSGNVSLDFLQEARRKFMLIVLFGLFASIDTIAALSEAETPEFGDDVGHSLIVKKRFKVIDGAFTQPL